MADQASHHPLLVAALGSLLLLAPAASPAQEADPGEGRNFGAEYSTLSPAQRALLDDIFRRFGDIVGREVDPEQGYNNARLSVRTTFDAVTHALTTSKLTDAETGESLGVALDLIDHLEAVHGRVKGAGGDRQFRIYVRLKPEALGLLKRSEEFVRKGDNTIFHKGYPLNYRQEGVPSMQFSMTPDGLRADIDVDYRSEKFPASLVNGHLTAANSDIRAGNHGRHNERWDGLVNWWEGFFDRLFSTDSYGDEDDDGREFPLQPRAGDQTIDVAVNDFLVSWLVDQQPNLAVAYLDREAYDCLAIRLEEEGRELDRGLAPIQMYARMKAVNDEIGKKQSLEEVLVGVRHFNPNFKLVRQDQHRQFVLQTVPRRLAEQMKCGSFKKFGDLPQERQLRLGDDEVGYFLSSFFVKGFGGRGTSLSLLWARRDGYWKIVSYTADVEPADEDDAMPDLQSQVEVAAVPRMEAAPGLLEAVDDFHEGWLVRKDYDRTLGYFSRRSYACVNLLRDPEQEPYRSEAEQMARLRLALERTGDTLGEVSRLEDVVEGVEPWDPRVRIVEHDRSAAFALFGLPGWAGEAADCRSMVAREGRSAEQGTDDSFGRYFASSLKVETYSGEPAVLYLAWEKEQGSWRIFAFKVVEP